MLPLLVDSEAEGFGDLYGSACQGCFGLEADVVDVAALLLVIPPRSEFGLDGYDPVLPFIYRVPPY